MSDADPIAFLTERLAAAERERDELTIKSERLTALQRVFVQIGAARDETQIAQFALRGAWLALEFTRAMWFTVDESGAGTALFDVDGNDEPTESEYGGSFPDGSALARCARGESDAAAGYAHDADAPLFDRTRRVRDHLRRRRARPVRFAVVGYGSRRACGACSTRA
jgi:hypothetical protein